MSITKTSFGKLPCGCEADLYILKNASGASVEITNYGGIISAINVPDKDGKLGNVMLGYDNVNGYLPLHGYMGALVGRVGNRIKAGKFTLNGVEYQVAKNEKGINHLHGGDIGFDRKLWDATPIEGICEDHLMLRYTSPDGEENYPGTLKVLVTYTFTDDNELYVHYEAVSDKDTLCSLTNHAYFNLACEGDVLDHTMEINADTFTVVDAECIPTGEMRAVGGTPLDLRTAKRIGDEIDSDYEQMVFGTGYDHNFNLNDDEMRFAAEVRDPKSGRVMRVFTDMPSVQFYCGNHLDSPNVGRHGYHYKKRNGFCLETQFAPDSINQPNFPDSVLRAGEKYDFMTVFSFDAE